MKTGILIAAGGTGGHISPGVSLARIFSQNGYPVTFITLDKNITYPDITTLAKLPGISILAYPAPRFPASLTQIAAFIKNFLICRRMLANSISGKRYILVGMGGYPAFPALMYCRLKGIPWYLCEQNVVPGKITRYFSRGAQKVFHSFPEAVKRPNDILSGNPLRSIFQHKKKIRPAAYPPKKILMIGGSLGATALNELYIAMRGDSFFDKMQITLVSGGKDISKPLSKNDKIESFIVNMNVAITEADLVISRAGSGLIYEILWGKRPAIYLPYPFAADNHQAANARSVEQAGYAKVIDVRPFQAQAALTQLKDIVSGLYLKQIVTRYNDAPVYPLDAHEKIFQMIDESVANTFPQEN